MNKEVIERVIERIKKNRTLYEQSEIQVRESIVNPILRGLGWDPENPEEVQHNVTTEEGIPDYSLLEDNKKVLFIEAKKLSVDIEKRDTMRQIANYCFGAGMEYGLLTNGSVWVLFRAFQKDTTMPERVVWKTDIENDDISATIRRLNTISKENIGDIETLIKKLQILDEIWQSLLEQPTDLVKGFVPVFDSLIREGYPDYKFEHSEIEDFITERVKELISPTGEAEAEPVPTEPTTWEGARPREMKIGTDNYEIKSSNEVLINTAEWLIRKGKLKRDDCPIATGHTRTRNLVNIQPIHRDGRAFINPKKLSNGLHIETNHSRAGCITNARQLLEKFGYRGNILSVT